MSASVNELCAHNSIPAMSNKIIRDGAVAVLITGSYGAGWSTWDSRLSVFDPVVVRYVLRLGPPPVPTHHRHGMPVNKECAAIPIVPCQCNKHTCMHYSTDDVVHMKDLCVEWVPLGVPFRVREYDGMESVEKLDMDLWTTVTSADAGVETLSAEELAVLGAPHNQ